MNLLINYYCIKIVVNYFFLHSYSYYFYHFHYHVLEYQYNNTIAYDIFIYSTPITDHLKKHAVIMNCEKIIIYTTEQLHNKKELTKIHTGLYILLLLLALILQYNGGT